jgi:hypothetical protein
MYVIETAVGTVWVILGQIKSIFGSQIGNHKIA